MVMKLATKMVTIFRVSRLLTNFSVKRNPKSPKLSKLAFGKWGEEQARREIEASGHRIIASGFTAPITTSRRGRRITAEIDLIAYDETVSPAQLVFIEVKTRSHTDLAMPEAAVDQRKQRRLIRAARIYRRLLRIEDEPFRFDVITVVKIDQNRPVITIFKNYFN
jgi:Holliday junction resolvase-like predicted endonuclease